LQDTSHSGYPGQKSFLLANAPEKVLAIVDGTPQAITLEVIEVDNVLEYETPVETSRFDDSVRRVDCSGIDDVMVDVGPGSVACGLFGVEGSAGGGATGCMFRIGFAMNLITSNIAAI
jgi:hypothetical protein